MTFWWGVLRRTRFQKTLPIVAAGTVVGSEQATDWNRVILLATPRIASGDVTKLSESVRAAVSKLTLTILATVKREAAGDGTDAYRLAEVGVAYSTTINQRLMTVSSDSAFRLGARLDFYTRQMLSENEKTDCQSQTSRSNFDACNLRRARHHVPRRPA